MGNPRLTPFKKFLRDEVKNKKKLVAPESDPPNPVSLKQSRSGTTNLLPNGELFTAKGDIIPGLHTYNSVVLKKRSGDAGIKSTMDFSTAVESRTTTECCLMIRKTNEEREGKQAKSLDEELFGPSAEQLAEQQARLQKLPLPPKAPSVPHKQPSHIVESMNELKELKYDLSLLVERELMAEPGIRPSIYKAQRALIAQIIQLEEKVASAKRKDLIVNFTSKHPSRTSTEQGSRESNDGMRDSRLATQQAHQKRRRSEQPPIEDLDGEEKLRLGKRIMTTPLGTTGRWTICPRERVKQVESLEVNAKQSRTTGKGNKTGSLWEYIRQGGKMEDYHRRRR